MALPVFLDGQVLTADDVNKWLLPRLALKASSTSRTSTTTLAPDPELTLTVEANAKFAFEGYLEAGMENAGGGNMKIDFTAPSGAALAYMALHNEGGGTGLNNSVQEYYLGTDMYVALATVQQGIHMRGLLEIGATAGSFTLTWAQYSSSGYASNLNSGSYISLRRIA